jgi:hypothetical protein
MTEFFVKDAEAGAYVNGNGTTIATDTTETYDTEVQGAELVVLSTWLHKAYDRRGERHDDDECTVLELLRLDTEGARWLRSELDVFLASAAGPG